VEVLAASGIKLASLAVCRVHFDSIIKPTFWLWQGPNLSARALLGLGVGADHGTLGPSIQSQNMICGRICGFTLQY
jgi:hypothetical protein